MTWVRVQKQGRAEIWQNDQTDARKIVDATTGNEFKVPDDVFESPEALALWVISKMLDRWSNTAVGLEPRPVQPPAPKEGGER